MDGVAAGPPNSDMVREVAMEPGGLGTRRYPYNSGTVAPNKDSLLGLGSVV